MRKLPTYLVLASMLTGMLVWGQASADAYTLQYRDGGVAVRRWVYQPIIISLSSSLNSPPSNIKPGSDVIGAARRALEHWDSVANIQFFEATSDVQSISAPNAGDHINLITVSNENAGWFASFENPGRTRVFYDAGGSINEADIALNPNVRFSSDGTPGTFDLESTFTHEVGHLLGLEHSAILAATMQPRQAMNGLFGTPQFTQRTLAEDDIAGARALYGSRIGTGSIAGRLIARSIGGQSQPIFGGHVFAEDPQTGRVIAGSVTLPSGDYRIDALPPGNVRVVGQSLVGPISGDEIAARGSYSGLFDTLPAFRTHIATRLSSTAIPVFADTATRLGFFVSPIPAPAIRPRLIGMNGELSTVALPLKPGRTTTVYVAGEGIDEIAAGRISSTSPFIVINRETVKEEFDIDFPAIGFEITVASNIPPGDYSLVLESTDGEVVYLAGVVTIEPGL